MTAKIPMVDLEQQTRALWPELEAAVHGVLRSGRFILGPNVEAFEREAAEFLGVRFAVGVGSGTDALVLGLRALGIGPGDEVIVPSFTFFATAEAVSLVGATPVFAEIDPVTFCLDPAAARAALSSRTRAIVPVHLFGHPADMAPLRELGRGRDIALLEDAAQAFGAEYRGARIGGLGEAAAFSFFPSKNLGAFGEAGLVATNDERIADSVRSLRAHGSRQRYVNTEIGYNARLDEIQAALLRVKLPHVARWNDERRRVAAEYTATLAGIPGVTPPSVATRLDARLPPVHAAHLRRAARHGGEGARGGRDRDAGVLPDPDPRASGVRCAEGLAPRSPRPPRATCCRCRSTRSSRATPRGRSPDACERRSSPFLRIVPAG